MGTHKEALGSSIEQFLYCCSVCYSTSLVFCLVRQRDDVNVSLKTYQEPQCTTDLLNGDWFPLHSGALVYIKQFIEGLAVRTMRTQIAPVDLLLVCHFCSALSRVQSLRRGPPVGPYRGASERHQAISL